MVFESILEVLYYLLNNKKSAQKVLSKDLVYKKPSDYRVVHDMLIKLYTSYYLQFYHTF